MVRYHPAFIICGPLLHQQWPILFNADACRARRTGAIALLSSAYDANDIGRVVILSVKSRRRGA